MHEVIVLIRRGNHLYPSLVYAFETFHISVMKLRLEWFLLSFGISWFWCCLDDFWRKSLVNEVAFSFVEQRFNARSHCFDASRWPPVPYSSLVYFAPTHARSLESQEVSWNSPHMTNSEIRTTFSSCSGRKKPKRWFLSKKRSLKESRRVSRSLKESRRVSRSLGESQGV